MLLACSQALYVPSDETVKNGTNIHELAEGRDLYIHRCGSCHNLYSPQKFSEEKWKSEMVDMKQKAKLSDAEAETIIKYLTGYIASPAEG